ncbi:hypothetical protein EYF80_036213 [Liparis tanakae]|uniref:Uncharacterized protein n=1 Tax=Liparis tanakae TaxID=230148 RepID=A0A4Z2GJZ7_9TELE|nr:hypothetical protein EYF80_036213 [Liparis tanakae]
MASTRRRVGAAALLVTKRHASPRSGENTTRRDPLARCSSPEPQRDHLAGGWRLYGPGTDASPGARTGEELHRPAPEDRRHVDLPRPEAAASGLRPSCDVGVMKVNYGL